ncbi:filamentous hemagglutinin N-terminal domain-containing protein [Candidatus Albibeggiatoa sp. nov. NOAA]|uniref:two-partner secretion domain-containing protein n=1 Tax=Candidatus Albibeggiatoa sp. nov. NOAA TaxID=3162724 RepID=UPI0032FAF9D0|nr:filamentous hemagglutinin N-terminal domain-containing protein [Thiotrichaceae bacterium]
MNIRILVLWMCFSHIAQADISINNDLLTTHNGLFEISQDFGQTVGSNLFHTFDSFNLNQGEIAQFSGSEHIQNIISRVIGGESSFINGTIRSTIPSADFYFLNPYGVLFGTSARLEIQGSFHASTADYIKLSDGGEFHARFPAHDLLTVAPVASFGFLTNSPAPITVSGAGEISQELAATYYDENGALDYTKAPLQLPNNQQFSLIGGEITISGHYDENSALPLAHFSQGRINLIGVASQGEVAIQSEQVQLTGFNQFADIRLNNVAAENHGGWLFIQSNQLTFDNSNIVSTVLAHDHASHATIRAQGNMTLNQSKINLSTESLGHAGNILIETQGHLTLQDSEIDAFTASNALGDAGDISITAQSLSLDNSIISSNTYGKGHAGHITIQNNGDFKLNESLVSAYTHQAQGHAGDVTIDNQGSINLHNSTINSGTTGQGNAGHVTITNQQDMNLSGKSWIESNTKAQGNAGDITIKNFGDMHLSDKMEIASGTDGDGDGGYIYVDNQGDLTIINHAEFSASTEGNGNAGGIVLNNQGDVILDQYGAIKSDTEFTGNAGHVTIEANNIYLKNGSGIYSSSEGSTENLDQKGSNAGNVTIVVRDTIQIEGNREISEDGSASHISSYVEAEFEHVRPSTSGMGGHVDIQARRILLSDGGQISVSAIAVKEGKTLQGGNINIKAEDVVLSGVNLHGETEYGFGSGIYALSLGFDGNTGDAGSITIEAQRLLIEDGGIIGTSTNHEANAGHINISVTESLDIRGDANHIALYEPLATQFEYLNNYSPKTYNQATSGIYSQSIHDSVQAGRGGQIDINAGQIKLSNHGTISTSSAGGQDAGNIAFKVNQLSLDTQARITSESVLNINGGNAGNISIAANLLQLANDTEISTESISGGGGGITLNIEQSTYLNRSEISTSVEDGFGNGGGLTLTAPQFLVMNHSELVAQAYQGNGGNIQIVADQFFRTPSSLVSASSQLGIDGHVQIDSPAETVSNDLLHLDKSFIKSVQVHDACRAALAGQLPTEFQPPLSLKVSLYQRPNDFIGDWRSSDAYGKNMCR